MVRIVSWNVAGPAQCLELIEGACDVALLQETPVDRPEDRIENGPGRAAVLVMSDELAIREVPLAPIAGAAADRSLYPVSCPGTLAVAELLDADGEPKLILVSAYVKWESVGTSWIVPDASAHRLISDISSLITTEAHRVPIIVAGDWNLFAGAGETPYWHGRYRSVFDRMEALGFAYCGPTAGLHRPPDTTTITEWPETATPTFHTTHQSPATAWRQLDHVFATRRIADSVTATALNEPDDWGPSDHCRIQIDVAGV